MVISVMFSDVSNTKQPEEGLGSNLNFCSGDGTATAAEHTFSDGSEADAAWGFVATTVTV